MFFFFGEIVVTVNILTVQAVMMKTAVVAMALEIFTDVGVPSALVWSAGSLETPGLGW